MAVLGYGADRRNRIWLQKESMKVGPIATSTGMGGLCRACPSTGLSLVPEASYVGGPVLARGATLGPKGLCRGGAANGSTAREGVPETKTDPVGRGTQGWTCLHGGLSRGTTRCCSKKAKRMGLSHKGHVPGLPNRQAYDPRILRAMRGLARPATERAAVPP